MQKKRRKKTFYNELHAITSTIPRYDVLIIMGNIIAKVGADNTGIAGTAEQLWDWGGTISD